MLSDTTWPNWKNGPAKDGVKNIFDVIRFCYRFFLYNWCLETSKKNVIILLNASFKFKAELAISTYLLGIQCRS